MRLRGARRQQTAGGEQDAVDVVLMPGLRKSSYRKRRKQ